MLAVTQLMMTALVAASSAIGTHHRSPEMPPVVTVHAKDFAYVAPKTVKSGATTFRLVNDGKTMHHLSIIRLQKGKTVADFVNFMKKPAPPFGWFTEVGGPNPALPGGTVEATLALEPGNYVMVCFIPSPGESAPHMMKGMVSELTVTSDKGMAMPASDVTIKTSDYAFAMSTPLTKGHHDIAVQNDAAQAHEVVVVQLAPGKTIADVNKWVDTDLMKGPPPGKPVGGMSGIAKGQAGSFSIDLAPGNYGLICFVPDAKDGKAHSMHGMTKSFTVAN
ncbi:MAG: hypothetical protein ABJE47_00135 [bacterium]